MRSRSSSPIDGPAALTLPLSGWADRRLAVLRDLAGASAFADITGAALLGERAALDGFVLPGRISAGGGCRLYPAMDGWIALNIARPDDRDLLPALLLSDAADIAPVIATWRSAALVARGREMGLAIAAIDEPPGAPAQVESDGVATCPPTGAPLVVDLSALWAGPLATHLLNRAGAHVVKVESVHRPDAMRDGDPALFARLNQHKDSVVIDLRGNEGRAALDRLLRAADIVVEAARPRALLQLGIDAGAIVRDRPGRIWLAITGHGTQGGAADHIGFGDDCAVAGGLSAALRDATGRIGFVGDAMADPLTGIAAAAAVLPRWRSGRGGHLTLSMSGTVRTALAEERERDGDRLGAALRIHAPGGPFPPVPDRAAATTRPFGADSGRWLEEPTAC